jgi:hypothetical protein
MRRTRGIAALVKELLTKAHVQEDQGEKLSHWQLIFVQSTVNGCPPRGEDLPHRKWEWPKNTWLQERRNHLRESSDARPSRRGTIPVRHEGAPGYSFPR